MTVVRWQCATRGIVAPKIIERADGLPRCPQCRAPMMKIEYGADNPPRDPRARKPPRGDGRPL